MGKLESPHFYFISSLKVTVAVAMLVKQSLPSREIHSSNPIINNYMDMTHKGNVKRHVQKNYKQCEAHGGL